MRYNTNMSFDYNNLSFGELGKFVYTVNEIPKGSSLKIEWDRHNSFMKLDRVEPRIFAKPTNYGFIPSTLDEDGDELDTLIVTEEALSTGIVVEARVIGVLNFEDDGEMDHKVIVVPADDRHAGEIISYKELGDKWAQQIEHHFTHYKDLKKPGSTKVLGFGDADEAWKIIEECIERAKNEK